MASDLSKIIPENLSTTLNALLAKETSLKECTKVDKRDLEHIELLRVDTEFVFDKLTSILSYYIPAQSASTIFNIMMAAPSDEISTKIDDDTADAMTEFISNTCGGLVTTINASGFEDLGQAKFNIQHKEILAGDSITSVDNMYRFLIHVEGKEITIFTQFEENFNDFITELTNSAKTSYPEIIQKENSIEKKPEENKEEKPKNEEDTIEKTENQVEEDAEDTTTNSKQKKLKLIIIVVAGLIVLTVISGIILYFTGAFDPVPIKKPKESNTTKSTQNKPNIIQYKTLKKVDFKMSDINIKRLNNKLELLTKYQVLTQKELEAQAQEEKKRIIRLKKEQALIKFAKQNKEEPIVIPKTSTPKKIITQKIHAKNNLPSKTIQKAREVTKPLMTTPSKLKFVVANSLRYTLFKKLVIKTNSKRARISICNSDTGKTQILIGPFESEQLQIKMNTLIKESDSTVNTLLSNITQEKFNTKCNF